VVIKDPFNPIYPGPTFSILKRGEKEGILGGGWEGYSGTQNAIELRLVQLAPIRKNNRAISGVERLRTPVAGILIVGLQLH